MVLALSGIETYHENQKVFKTNISMKQTKKSPEIIPIHIRINIISPALFSIKEAGI